MKRYMNIMKLDFRTDELRIKVPWGHVAAKTWGSPADFPILMVHGIMDNAGSFNRLIPFLPRRFYYVSIDLPGHGLSSSFPAEVPLEFFNYVFCIELVLQELGWRNCISIAHSMGALIMFFYTYLYPGRIKKFVSIDTSFPSVFDGDLMKFNIISAHKTALDYLNNKTFTVYSRENIIYALQTKRSHYLKKEAAEALFERSITKIDGGYKYNRDSRMRHNPRPNFNCDQCFHYVGKETVPTLFIVASTLSDWLSQEGIRKKLLEMVKCKRTVQYEVVEGNHDLHLNHPERVAPLIEKFLNQVESKL